MPKLASRSKTRTVALIVAAGSGQRFGASLPKQYALLAGQPILTHTLKAFTGHDRIDEVLVVIGQGHEEAFQSVAAQVNHDKLLPPVIGAQTRQGSVMNGLKALQAASPDIVLIHDAARPFVSPALIGDCIEALVTGKERTGVCAAARVNDTLRRVDDNTRRTETIDRTNVWRAHTPQGFGFSDILKAHELAASQKDIRPMSDDIAIAEASGFEIVMIEDTDENFKITTRKDLLMGEEKLARSHSGPTVTRTGLGYDVHQFERGRPLILCGIHLKDSPLGLKGHSDADVALHALTDALLGAVGAGDIGEHFPPSQKQWKGAPSHIFVEAAMAEIRRRGGVFINADLTIICEAPKVGPFKAEMRARVAQIIGCSVSAINIKATTTEGLGFTGRGEGIAAQAVVCVALPGDASAQGTPI